MSLSTIRKRLGTISDWYLIVNTGGLDMCGICVIIVAAVIIITIDTLTGRAIRKQYEENERIWQEFLKLEK